MTDKEKRERLLLIMKKLAEVYPVAECALQYGSDPWRLLVMGRLSAQCTDARVNEVSVDLFERFPNAQSMAEADVEEIERIVEPCGLYRMKAANLKYASKMLIEDYGGVLPNDIDELLKFPGVGRKIANLLVGDIYGGDAVVCDTHCMRICARLGMYPEKLRDPVKIEKILRKLIPSGEGADFCHRIVLFGRDTCSARAPRCTQCPLCELCERNLKGGK